MSGEFTFNGISSASFGLLVSNISNFGAPSRVVEKVQVPYRNGALLIDTGTYTNYTVSYEVALIHDAVVNTRELAAWLLAPQGYCELTDSYNAGETRYAAYYGDLNYTMAHLNRYGRATISFDCKPQRYLVSGQTTIIFSTDGSIDNDTLFVAKPLIKVNGIGTCYIGDYEITLAPGSFAPQGFDHAYIDCETMQCYYMRSLPGSGMRMYNANDLVALPQGFPVLAPGSTDIDLDSVTSVEITPRWWRL